VRPCNVLLVSKEHRAKEHEMREYDNAPGRKVNPVTDFFANFWTEGIFVVAGIVGALAVLGCILMAVLSN